MTVTSEDRAALRSAVSELLADHSSEDDVRRVMATPEGYDAKTWRALAELGVQGLLVPTTYGGSGSSFVEVGVVLEEVGRSLLPAPLLSTLVATDLLAQTPAGAAYLPGIAAGEVIATVAVHQPGAPGDVVATNGVLSGSVGCVLDAQVAQLLLVAASDGVYAVSPGPGVDVQPLATTDQTRRLARVELGGAPGTRLGGVELAARAHSVAAAALACEQAGGAAAVLAATVSYAQVRSQFGRLIGSFQAIKHICADMFLEVESAKAAAQRAVEEVATDGPELAELASIAKAWCSDTYVRAAEASMQVHGGLGFTWEHSAHLHLKRAKTDELLFGDARHHRAHLADALGI